MKTNSSSFELLDQFLEDNAPGDYWEDMGISYAHDLIQRLTPEGWDRLRVQWQARDCGWQVRVAQIVAFGDPEEAVAFAFSLVERGGEEVRFTAMDSLRGMNLSLLDKKQLAFLRHIADVETTGKLQALILSDLIKRVDACLNALPG